MYRKKLMKACLTGALVVSVGVSNVPYVAAAEPDAAVETETGTEETDGQEGSKEGAGETEVDQNAEEKDAASEKDQTETTENGETKEEASEGTTSTPTPTPDASTGDTENSSEKSAKTVVLNVQFVDESGTFISGGDYFVPEGINNYSVLQQYMPEGYEMLTGGDFNTASGSVTVTVKKIEQEATTVTMNIAFKDGDEVVAGGDYTVPAGTQNYSVLQQYVPKGYEMTVSGDFTAAEGAHLDVSVKKIAEEAEQVTVNVVFMYNGQSVGGGDCLVSPGNNNYSVLESILPEGYEMTVSGDFYAEEGTKLEVNVEKVSQDVIMNVVFKDGDEVVGGGDYFLPEGVQNYSVLEQYVPAGYQMTVSGDFTVVEGGSLEVNVEKIQKDVIMNISFQDGDEVIAAGDYFVPEGIQNYSVLEQYVPEGYEMTVSGDFTAAEGGKLVVNVQKISETVTMNIAFKDGDEVVAGGDYKVPEGVQNYSVLEQYVPEGYQMTVSGDFFAKEGAHLDVSIEKISEDITMNILFKYGDEVVAGGDYFVPAGVQNYSVLEKYVPEGYEMTVSGDFFAVDGGSLVVSVEPQKETVVMNILFKYGDEVIAGGDYFVPAGVQNYSVLEKYVPEGYQMTVSGDFMAEEGAHLDVSIEKISNEVIMNISFKDGDTVVAGGDYFVPAGVQNYSILEQYVPAGYQMTVSGDFMAEDGAHLDVNVEKVSEDVIMNISFKDGDTVVAGGDYFVPAGVNNYSILEQYVPEGYQMTVSGDFYAEDGAHLDVSIEKISEDVIMNISFKDGDEFIAGGDYFVPAGVNNYSILEQYVPEGYQMTVSGDFMAEEGAHLDVNVEKIQKTIIMNIAFKDGDEVVAGGDYFVPEGIQNYSVLEQYVPEGYQMTVSGDFFAVEGSHLDVNIEKVQKDIIMNIAFKDGDEFIAGGDYFVPEGIQNYSVLEKYVPEGYQMTVSGDFFAVEGSHLDVNVEKIQKDIIMNISFKEGDTVIAGGDYFVPEGIQNYSVLEKYVPEGYRMTVSGDFFAIEGSHLDVNIEKIEKKTALTITFETVYGEVVGQQYLDTTETGADGEDWTVTLGTDFQLPEGYQLATGVDQITSISIPYGSVGGHTMLVEPVAQEQQTKLTVTFETVYGEVVDRIELSPEVEGEHGEDWTVTLGTDFQLPEGYELAEGVDQVTDITIPYGSVGGHTMLVQAVTNQPEDPEDPDQPGDPGQPEDPDQTDDPDQNVDDGKDQVKTPVKYTKVVKSEKTDDNDSAQQKETTAPKTGDATNAAPAVAGLLGSLLAIGAILARRIRR